MKEYNDPFDNKVFDAARVAAKVAFELMKMHVPTSEQTLYMCHKCGSKNISSVARQVRSADEGTSVFNSCRDCGKKRRDG